MFCRRILIFLQCLGAFLRAWRIRAGCGLRSLVLPEVRDGEKHLGDDVRFLLTCADFIVRLGCMRTGRKCFFRSYMLASVLRKHGQEAEINIGMRNLGAGTDTAGHCWVTMPDGGLLDETGDLPSEYPVMMGRSGNGIRYWVGGSGAGTGRDDGRCVDQGGDSG